MNKEIIYDEYLNKNMKEVYILIHGFGGTKDSTTNTCLKKEFITKNIGYVSFNLPGYNNTVLTINKSLEHLNEVTNYIKNKCLKSKINLFGTSFGGYIAMLGLIKNKEAYNKIILRSPALKMYELFKRVNNIENTNEIQKIMGVTISKDFCKELEQNNLFKIYDGFKNNNILIIHGDKDETVPIKDSQEFSQKNDIILKVIKGATHSFKNEETLKIMLKYINNF